MEITKPFCDQGWEEGWVKADSFFKVLKLFPVVRKLVEAYRLENFLGRMALWSSCRSFAAYVDHQLLVFSAVAACRSCGRSLQSAQG